MSAVILAEVFLMAVGAIIGIGILLGFVAAAAYFMGTLDD